MVLKMTHPGIFALVLGVAIGTAIYYFFGTENRATPHQYSRERAESYDYESWGDYHDNSRYVEPPRRRRRRVSNESCMICLDSIAVNTATRTLEPCGHQFHCTCISKWLREKMECPVCRANVQ